MKRRMTQLLAASLSAVVLAGAFAVSAHAAEDTMSAKPGRIAVTGEGSNTAAPDMAILNLTVLREAKTAREAMTANNEAMAKVLAAMKQAGIAERDLQTGGINIQPRYVYPDDKNGLKEPEIASYSVSNSLTVRVRDLAKVGDILDQSITLGVNQGGDLTFVNDDPAAVINEARKRAVADAIAKAQTLAEAAGVSLGRVVEISEQSYAPRPMPIARAEFKSLAAAPVDSVPVAAGENRFNVNVNMVFEIKP
ncbi:SIMPL domain-containing protein [Daeguia caeni]|uniref:SIMPL domain-containing protein n=1 Tax=Daeguia caeni TaxID=439612 RepID=A0ABV9H5I7_9HYPH